MIFTLFFSLFALEEDLRDFWPEEIKKENLEIIIYQPQMEYYDKITLAARSAISVKQGDNTYFGALWFKGRANIDKEEQLVKISDLEIKDIKFLEGTANGLKGKVVLALNNWNPVMTLQSIISDLDLLISEKEFSEQLKNDPPEIIFSSKAALLVVLDGEPVVKSVDDTKYEYVLNTPNFIVTKDRYVYYLYINDLWYKSSNILSGWRNTVSIPEDIKSLVKDNDKDVNIAGISEEVIPEIIVRTKPAELISTNGKPEFRSVEGTNLLYLKNSSANVILDKSTMKYYFLASGRWFISENLGNRAWDFIAGDNLPKDFQKIPEDSDISEVRVSISGTKEAKEAVLESQIPQTMEIDRKTKTTKVQYDGQPQFRTIFSASVSYAINSDKTVIKIRGNYYCVDEGVWFIANHYNGPWEVAISIPEEIYSIPPEEPIYHVRYVHIYDYTPTTVVVGYLPGYHGNYIYHGCVVYGTGYYYEPWHGHYFYPRPWTYGYRVYYHPFYGWVVYYAYPWYWYSYYPYHCHTHYYTYNKPSWKKKKLHPYPFIRPGYKFNGKYVYKKKTTPVVHPFKKNLLPKPNNLFVDKKGVVYKKDNVWFKLKGNKWNKFNIGEESNKKPVIKTFKKKKDISIIDYHNSRENAFFKVKKAQTNLNNGGGKKKFKNIKKKMKLKN